MKATRGFTLVEILIVVVILGILAAIVVPQFTEASTEAKTNSLCSDLQTLRSQIELFKAQHNDYAPGNAGLAGSTGAVATDFMNQMVFVTDITGSNAAPPSKVRNPAVDPPLIYGPYLERVPINPFNDSVMAAPNEKHGLVDDSGVVDDAGSWDYNIATGEIFADDTTDLDGDGIFDHEDL
jgi:general secretion pathway protein G